MSNEEIEELKADIEEYRDSTTWWSNRFNAVERNNRELMQEIERLNNLLKETSQTLSEQTTKAITLKSENERLKKELKSLQDSYDIEEEQANYHIDLTDDLREEVDRLNNIINELKKDIENKITFCSNEANGSINNKLCKISIQYLEHLKNKLQELRGVDKK